MSDDTKTSAVPIVFGALAVVAIGIGALVFWPMPHSTEPVTTAGVDTIEIAPTVTADAPELAAPAPDPVAAVEPVPAPGPQFDTFRVEPDGNMVIAGRAAPGQVVDVLLGGDAIDRVTSDASGSFVAFPQAGPSDAPRRLSLLADPDGAAIGSETSYIVAPIGVAEQSIPTPTETQTADGSALVISPEVTEPVRPSAPAVDAAISEGPATPVAPTVLEADADGVRVVQSAVADDPELAANVALDAITYDPTGDVLLSGRASGDGSVQVYLDNQAITTTPVLQGGDWQIDLPDVDTGVYTLRIDEVDGDGTVVSRIEIPFRREEADDVAAVLAEETSAAGFEIAVKTVQPGATLWAIARDNLGEGILYVEVFEANRDLIKDPDLIYPGQIFRIPEVNQ